MERRTFLKTSAMAGAGLMASQLSYSGVNQNPVPAGKRVGIIGLDTSHAPALTRSLNAENPSPDFAGYRVLFAYPYGSKDIESSVSRRPRFTAEVQAMGVQLVETIPELLERVDVVLLLTNDGRPHLEQVIPVLKAGKRVFIDKPLAGTLTDAFAIFQAAKDFNQPVYSTSGVRYLSQMDEVVKEQKIGKLHGVDTFSSCLLEPTHPDLFWYGIHGVEAIYAAFGTGCKTLSRVHTPNHDIVTGIWNDDRVAVFRGLRAGRTGFGGFAFGETGYQSLGEFPGYEPMLREIVKYWQTGVSPVPPEETLEVFTFMEAADESKRRNGASVSLDEVAQMAREKVVKIW